MELYGFGLFAGFLYNEKNIAGVMLEYSNYSKICLL